MLQFWWKLVLWSIFGRRSRWNHQKLTLGFRKWVLGHIGLTKGKSEWPPAGHLSMGSGRYGCQSTSFMNAYHWSKGEPQLTFQSWDLRGGSFGHEWPPPIPTLHGPDVSLRRVKARQNKSIVSGRPTDPIFRTSRNKIIFFWKFKFLNLFWNLH